MKYLLVFPLVFSLFIFISNAQVTISGKINSVAKTDVLHLTNLEGSDFAIKVTAKNEFSFKKDSLQNGFYSLDGIGSLYLANGYNFKIVFTKTHGYTFEGIGAQENEALAITKSKLGSFLPIDKNSSYLNLAQEAFYIEPTIFLHKIDSFKNYSSVIFDKSTDTFFRKYAALDLDFYCNTILSTYYTYYGIDLEIMNEAVETNDMHKIMSLTASAHKKQMGSADRKKITAIVFKDWDKKNEVLFKNSFWYRQALTNYLMYLNLSNYKYLNLSLKNTEDATINKLTIAKSEIANPYILSHFAYNYTSDIIQNAKDTTVMNKYYYEFINSRPERQDYIKNLTEIYNYALAYRDYSDAPLFIYSDALGKKVGLQNLKGKYVYIDFWATWCGPCKKEIPDLQKLETSYKGKNIHFVSISVDEQKNKAKWKDYVTKNKLSGIQLLADSAFESSFVKKMRVNSIPHFTLIDPKGKLIAGDALRPSNPELKKILDKLL